MSYGTTPCSAYPRADTAACPDARAGASAGWRGGCKPDIRTFLQRCAALLAALDGPAVISHHSAARLLGLPLPPGRPAHRICLTHRPPATTNDPLGGAVHVRGYADADVIDVGGVPVPAGSRLVLDCCEHLAPDSALAIADAALFRSLTTADDLVEDAHGRRGRPRPGVALTMAQRADPGGRNWFESMSRWWLLEAGLPRPELQACFRDDGGEVRACVDMWFRGRNTIGEADGARKYDEPGSLYTEKRREDWPRDTGREVVRRVPAEMRTPRLQETVVERFHRAFARRS